MLPTDEKQKNTISSVSVMRSPEKVYKLFRNFKDFEFILPNGWNDKYLAIFIQSCRIHLDDLKKTELGDKERWHAIALFGAKVSENNTLFTSNNCRKVAHSIKKYVLCNLNRMVNNEVLHAFYCDIKDLLEYFPPESNIRLTRSTSNEKTSNNLKVSPKLKIKVEDAIYDLLNKNVAAIKNTNYQFLEESNKILKDRFGISCNIKEFLRLKKEEVIIEVSKFKKISHRKRVFNKVAKQILPIFDFIEPTNVQKDDFLNSFDQNSLLNDVCYFSSNKKGKDNESNVKNPIPGGKSNSGGQKAMRAMRKRNITSMKKQSSGSVREFPVEHNQNKPDLNEADVVKSEIKSNKSLSHQENRVPLMYTPSTSQQIENHDLKENMNRESNKMYSSHTGNKSGMISEGSVVQDHEQKKNTQCFNKVVNLCIDPCTIYGEHSQKSNNDNSNLNQNDVKDHSMCKEPAIENSLSLQIQNSDDSAQNCFRRANNNQKIKPVQKKRNYINSPLSPAKSSPEKNVSRQFSDDKNRPFKKRARPAMTNDISSHSGLKFGTNDQQADLSKVESNEVSDKNYNANSLKPNVLTSTSSNSNDSLLSCTTKESKESNSVEKTISEIINLPDRNNFRTFDDKENPQSSPSRRSCKRGRPHKDKANKHLKVGFLNSTKELKLFKRDDNLKLSRSVKSDDKNRPLKKRGRYTYEDQGNFDNKSIPEINHSKSSKTNCSSGVITSLYEKGKTLKKKKDSLLEAEFKQNKTNQSQTSQIKYFVPGNCGILMSLRNRETSSIQHQPNVKKALSKENNGKKEVFKAEYCVNLEKSSIVNLNPVVKLIDFVKNPSAILRSQVKVTEHTHNNENIKITDEETVTITLSTVNNKSPVKSKSVSKTSVTQKDHSKTTASTSGRKSGKYARFKTNQKTTKPHNKRNATKIGKMKLRSNHVSISDREEVDTNTKRPDILSKPDAIGSKGFNISKNNTVSLNSKVSTPPSMGIKTSLHSNIANSDKSFPNTSLSISNFQQLNLSDFDGKGREVDMNNILPNMSVKSLSELQDVTALLANTSERARLVELITCSFEISHPVEKYDYSKPGWFGDYSKDFFNWEICKVQGLVSKFEEQLKERNKNVEDLEKIVENMDITKSLSK